MKTLIKTSLLLAGFSLSAGALAGGHGPHWSYDGAEGPEHWGSLHPEFSVCSTGKNQSPVDLTRMVESELAPIEFSYKPGGAEIVNNGHTVQVNYAPGSFITVDGIAFQLLQFHFHAPSENTIEGESFPLEGHLVHADAQGNLAVIGVMFEAGSENSELAKAWAQMPQAGQKQALVKTMDARNLLPENRDYYRFTGSLTTPPCSEGVRWMVMKDAVNVSAEQVSAFSDMMGHANNRPVQPLNARIIAQ